MASLLNAYKVKSEKKLCKRNSKLSIYLPQCKCMNWATINVCCTLSCIHVEHELTAQSSFNVEKYTSNTFALAKWIYYTSYKEIWLAQKRHVEGRQIFMSPSRPHVSRHNALCCITSYFSFWYNKQLITQLVGRHEDLFLGWHESSGGTNLHVSLQTGQ